MIDLSELPATQKNRGAIHSFAVQRLTSPAFVVAVTLLVVNDWVLKPAFGNWFTGKLSDVAGLAAFTLFWCAFFPRHSRFIALVTALGFILWKSPFADPVLSEWNSLGAWPMSRVVDYSDLLALLVLPACVATARRDEAAPRRTGRAQSYRGLGRRVGAVCTAVIAVFAFAATSVPLPSYDLRTIRPEGFVLGASREEVMAGLKATGLYQFEYGMTPKDEKKNPGLRMLKIYIRQPPERDIGVELEIREIQPAETRIRLLEVSAPGPAPNPEAVARAFEKQVMQPLQKWLSERPSR